MRRAIAAVLTTALVLPSTISALQVTPGSSCASTCLDSTHGDIFDPAASTTNTSDIVCYDVDYSSTTTGVKFKDCLECLQTSRAANDSETDVSWFIYNLRYASAVCLYDYPTHEHNTTTTCDVAAACQPLQGAFETGLDLQKDTGEYEYCSVDDSVFYGTGIDDCVSCLRSSPDSYLANFLIALQAGCQQQPASGDILGLSGELFSGSPMNITSTSSNSTAATTSDPKEALSTGAIVGVVVGAAVLLLIAMLLFYLYWRRQQSYDSEDMIISDPSDFYGKGQGRGSYMTSLTSGYTSKPVPIYTTDHKPPPPSYAPPGSRAHEMDYMNNAEYYDRLQGSRRNTPMAMTNQLYNMNINSANHVDTSALPAHPAYIPRGHGRLGSRASRNSTPSISSLPRYNKPDSYTAQIYMNSLEDAGEPAQPAPAPALEDHRPTGVSRETSPTNIQIELAGLPEESAPRASMPNPMAARQGGRTTPIPLHALDGRDTPAPAPVPSQTSSSSNGGVSRGPSRGPSLILPSVPRIKLPGRKPPRLTITGASPVEDISGPLAFPDSRFTQANDRIVEQMVHRGDTGEVPLGSGKSYLYG